MLYSRLVPLRYIGHALKILSGKYDDPNEPGQLRHYQALSTALAGTVGMGNVSGVAVAITMGGPGAIFWMWISALLGISTKFFTCSLAVMFRGIDSAGEIQGGPMYFITEGLGKNWKPMSVFFSVVGMIGVSPLFQANQLTQMIRDVVLVPNNIGGSFQSDLITGVRRAAFSNEAGLGTAPMAHGAAKTSEPIREGLVAMLGPIIDTIIVCTLTALAIIITDTWIESSADGITLTALAFDNAIPVYGKYILTTPLKSN